MAKFWQVKSYLIDALKEALSNAGIKDASNVVATEWPTKAALEDVGNNGQPLVALTHRFSHFAGVAMDFEHWESDNAVGIKSVVNDTSVTPGQTITITIGLAQGQTSPNEGDIVSCILKNGDFHNAATYTAAVTDDINAVAAGLAAAINTIFQNIAASSSGPIISITNNDTVGYTVASHVANQGTIATGTGEFTRQLQINCWTGNLDDKGDIYQAVEDYLIATVNARGFYLSTGEHVNLAIKMTKPDDANTDKDVYTDIFIIEVNHFSDVTKPVFGIVATDPQLSTSNEISGEA